MVLGHLILSSQLTTELSVVYNLYLCASHAYQHIVRFSELQEGIEVTNEKGEVVGNSKVSSIHVLSVVVL